MAGNSSRWTQLAMRSKLAIRRESADTCNFHDVMGVYDREADDAIDKLNSFRDISGASGSGDFGRTETVIQTDHNLPGNCGPNHDVVLAIDTVQSVDESAEDPGEGHDSEATTVLIQNGGRNARPQQVAPQEVSANSNTKSSDQRDTLQRKKKGRKRNDRRRKSEDMVLQNSKSSSSLSSLEETPSKRKGSQFIMSAPIQLQFNELKMNAAFMEVKDFLAKEKYSRFVGTLVRAIKSDSVHAVKVMVEILKMFGFDLYEPMFRESVYTASMLHVALLFKRDEICLLLIKEFPKLVTVKYESEKFQNQTAIHIAASNGQCKILSDMLAAVDEETGRELLNTIADGSYFTDVHQAGALALTAAAYSGHHEMLRMLIERGADPDVKGLNGNTVLHCIVTLSAMYPQSETPKILFEEVWDTGFTWWQRRGNIEGEFHSGNQRKMAQVDAFRYLLSIRNKADQNVLSLAVHLHSNLTLHILNIEHIYKLPQTKFGAMSWSTYDVTEVASYAPPSIGRANRYNAESVLHILAHRAKLVTQDEDESYRDLVEEEPIRTLVKMKWQTYRFVYIAWFTFHLLAMTCLTGVVLHFYQPDLNQNTFHDPLAIQHANGTAFAPIDEDTDPNYRAVHPWYILFGVYPVVLIVLEFLDIFSTGYSNLKSLDTGTGRKSKKHKQYLFYLSEQYSATGNAPYRITGVIFSLSTLIWLCFHFAGDIDQDMPLSLTMIFGWIFMLYFTRGCRHICEFSIMMQKMFFQDCAYFIAVYSFFWLAFSTGMHVLLFHGNTPAPHFGNTLYHMLNIITDAGDKSSSDGARQPAAAATLLSIYAVVSVVLLLNMLIAMMNTSYEAVKTSKTNVYRNQQLSIMLMLERRLWWWVWLCETSQRFTWSAKKPSCNQEKNGEESGIDTSPRVYLEITEKSSLGEN